MTNLDVIQVCEVILMLENEKFPSPECQRQKSFVTFVISKGDRVVASSLSRGEAAAIQKEIRPSLFSIPPVEYKGEGKPPVRILPMKQAC